MFRLSVQFCGLALLLIIPIEPATALAQDPGPALTEVTWDQVKPVFQKRCFACHRGEQARGGLDLSSVGGIKAGSTSGVAVVSGKPEESMIYTLPAHLEKPNMPPNRAKIAQRELDLIFGWIQGGLSERVTAATATSANSSRPMAMRPSPTVSRTKMSHADASKNSAKTTPAGTSTSLIGAEAPARIVRRQSYVVTALATSPTASLVAVSAPRQILVYQWTDQSLVSSIPFPEGDVFSLRFSRDGSILIAGGGIGADSGKVIGFDVATGERVFEIGNENDVVLAADRNADGRFVIGGRDRQFAICTSPDQCVHKVATDDEVVELAITQDGTHVIAADVIGNMKLCSMETGALAGEFALPTN